MFIHSVTNVRRNDCFLPRARGLAHSTGLMFERPITFQLLPGRVRARQVELLFFAIV